MLKIALTGGIAAGKSTVAEQFRQRGVAVIDTDRIARDVVATGEPALEEIRAEFGDDILDDNGKLNRSRLRTRIFENPDERGRLNTILHPRIIQRLQEELLALADQPYVIIEVPLLVEGGFEKDFDRVLVVDVPQDVQIKRLMERDGSDPETARHAVAAQADRDARLAHADDIIVNDGPTEGLAAEVDKLDARYREFASKAGAASEEGNP